MNGIALVLAIAVTVEAVVDAIRCIYGYVIQKEYKKLVARISALATSILLCFIASRGANYINDLISRINQRSA